MAFLAPYVAVAIACSTTAEVPATADGSAGTAEAGAGGDATTANDATTGDAVRSDATAPFPLAKGDPCRGVPLPANQHHVPSGMCASVVTPITYLRQITFAPNGDLLGVEPAGSIKRLRDLDGDGFFQQSEIVEYANTVDNGNNVHIDVTGGYIYAGTLEGVKRWPYSAAAANGGPGEDVVIDEPSDGHPKHTVHVYDGFLYVHLGSLGNIDNASGTAYDTERSLIRRFPLASFVSGKPFTWLSGQVFAGGLRNANGFTKNAAGRMYAVVNGIDDLWYGGQDVHDDNPGEQLVQLGLGKQYGFPFCFTAQRAMNAGGQVIPAGTQLAVSPDIHDDAWCATNSTRPATFTQAHSAPLDITFFDDHPRGALPERYRGGAFVALHGSHNRSPATGYKVVWIPFDAAGNSPMPTSTATTTTFPHEVVLGGGTAGAPVDGPWAWTGPGDYADAPRFSGVAISPIDGALYAASDEGYLYRVGLRAK